TEAEAASLDPASGPGGGLSPPVLVIDATDPASHTISLGVSGSELTITVNGSSSSQALDSLSGISITGAADYDDTLTVDLTGGDILVPITFDGGAGGYDTLAIHGGSVSDSIAFDGSSGVIRVDSTVVTYTGLEPTLV